MLRDSGHFTAADEATGAVPDASEGQIAIAVMAFESVPSLADLSHSGHASIADEANVVVPETSEGQPSLAEKAGSTVPSLVNDIAEAQIRRLFYIRAQSRLTNSAKALVRRNLGFNPNDPDKKLNIRAGIIVDRALAKREQKPEDAAIANALALDLDVIAVAAKPIGQARKEIEVLMKKLARSLPVYPWAKNVHGFGEMGLAVIVAEAGDLSRYPKKGHLWKRLGLSVHDGKAYSTWRTSKPGLTAEQWTEAGYSPRRRAEMHAVIADPLFRAQSVAKGPYRAIYERRRAATAIAHDDWTPMHSHMDGLRVMTKYLIRDLWVAWRSEQSQFNAVSEG